MSSCQTQRVVVTGLGIVTAIGHTPDTFASALFEGRCGIGPVDLFDTTAYPCRRAAQVRYDQLASCFGKNERKRASRCDLLGMLAARQAWADAGLVDVAPDVTPDERRGIVLGGGAGGMLSWEAYRRARRAGRRPLAGPLLSSPPCTLTDRLAKSYGLIGPRSTVTTACSSSSTAIGVAFDLIRRGEIDLALTGGAEAMCELTFAGFNALRVMSPEACRPFDAERRGLSLGEGAAVLVLEAREPALERGARIYAEILGYAVSSDAYHMTAPHPEGVGMRAAMARAMSQAGLTPDQVDYINAHGTATPVNDPLETAAIKAVFGKASARCPAVSSTKSMVGHCLGAAGGIEAVATVLAVHRQMAPPTIGLVQTDPLCDLDYVPGRGRRMSIRHALSNSFAFGGNNTCVAFGRFDHTRQQGHTEIHKGAGA
jgi:3-oxoacyl-[acyl-carrier-protein] synthase II